MAFKSVFSSMKQEGLIKQIDQYLLTRHTDGDRANVTNSPSSALGCVRANYYQRSNTPREPVDGRVQRIFDNGHGMHERIQGYLRDMGVLLMDEVPLMNEDYEIQGHTDGILAVVKKRLDWVRVLELKSINGRGFQALREPLEKHKAQAQVYLFCAEEQRLYLQKKYPTLLEFKRSALARRKMYRKKYLHLEDGEKWTRGQKINFKVNQHMMMDEILYHVKKPIEEAVVLYECKDTQNMKEYVIKMDEVLMDEVLYKFEQSNEAWDKKKLPPRECKNKSEGRFCNFVNTCFE